MSVLLQIIATGAQLVLVANTVPELKYEQSCRSATRAAAMPNRNEDACLQDERAARQKLTEEWKEFTPTQKSHCLQLSRAGGYPSYVELLTCMEMSKAAANLPAAGTNATPPIDRSGAKPSSAR
jgi:hypothetical protein